LLSQPKIGIVLVNLNTYQDTSVCLRSLREATYRNTTVIVVDNGSNDGSGAKLREEFPEVVHLRSERNMGFTGGNNLGIAYALGDKCDHILLLNNDTIITPGFLEPLVARLTVNDKTAAVSGKIYYWPESYGGQDNVIWYAGCFQKWHTGYHHTGVMEVDRGQYDQAVEVPYASGCMMLMRGDLVRNHGMLSDDYFIYWEEADWCHRMRDLGYVCYYEPKSLIYHNFKSAPLGKETPFYMYMQTRNAFVYAKQHYTGLTKLRYWTLYPLYLGYRLLFQVKAGNTKSAKAMLLGIVDYFKGFSGMRGLKERGYVKA
jgi:GT2 family glycosyltransferase